jgi:hypothetical protein
MSLIKFLVKYISKQSVRTPAKPDQPHKNFCVLPFIHLATTTEGTCRLCCKVNRFNTINKPDGTPYNVNVDSIDEIWNSDHYTKIRSRVLAGEQLPECATCWREEEIFSSNWGQYKKETDKSSSKRRKENQKWLYREKTRLTDDWKTVVDDPKIRYYDVRLSNLCNLKCRMCWPHFSSQIVKEQKQFADAGLPTHYKEYDLPDWDATLLWEGINNNIIDIEEITFVGGEPTLHNEMYELLDTLIEQGISKNIRLKLTTNLTNLQPRLLKAIPHFKNVIVNTSIDGIGKVNDYIRYPSDWTTVSNNLDTLLDMLDGDYLRINVSPVVQAYNIFDLGNIVQWYVEKWTKYQAGPNFELQLDLLYDPDHLNVCLLNSTAKKQFIDDIILPILDWLNDIINNIEDQPAAVSHNWKLLRDLRYRIVNIAVYMKVIVYGDDSKLVENTKLQETNHDKKLAKKLADYTKQLDKHRGQDVTDIIPGFYEYIK